MSVTAIIPRMLDASLTFYLNVYEYEPGIQHLEWALSEDEDMEVFTGQGLEPIVVQDEDDALERFIPYADQWSPDLYRERLQEARDQQFISRMMTAGPFDELC